MATFHLTYVTPDSNHQLCPVTALKREASIKLVILHIVLSVEKVAAILFNGYDTFNAFLK